MENFTDPSQLTSAYFRSKGKPSPGEDAFGLVKTYVQGKCRWHHYETHGFAEEVINRGNFDVCDVAESFLGIHLYLDDLSELDSEAGAKVFGLALPEERTIKICTRTESYEPLFRSTVMHEVAHVLKHRRSRKRAMCYSPMAKRRPREEMEADRFMAEALLPKPMLYLAVIVRAEQLGMSAGEAFGQANTERGRFQWRRHYLPFIIDRLYLSRELIALKLLHLGKIDQSTFDYHRSYSLSTRWRKVQPGFDFRFAVEAAAKRIMAGKSR